MKPSAVSIIGIVAVSLLSFAAGCVSPGTIKTSAPTPETPAIVEASPVSPDAPSASLTLPTPPSFDGREADAASDRVTAYLRWVAQMEVRRRLALVDLNRFPGSDAGRQLERISRGEIPPRPSGEGGTSPAEREALRQAEESIAGMSARLKEVAQEAKSQTAPPELERFHRAYREFVPWAGDVFKTMWEMQVEMMKVAASGDQESARKLMVRFALMQQEMGDQEARTKRLLGDLNNELDAVRAHTRDLPESLRTLRIETM